jgi:uncharacterized membrane protein
MPAPDRSSAWSARLLPSWRREALRTTLWLVPGALVLAAVALFGITTELDHAVYRGDFTLPSWADTGSADAARSLLSTIAAAVTTVVGVVFSVTIVALTLASQQFGPRMLRTFIRDIGTQVTLGAFVATSVYSVLALGSITDGGRHGPFVPHIGVTVALALLVVDLLVLIYFIHHIAVSIQLPRVIASISNDLTRTIEIQFPRHHEIRNPTEGTSAVAEPIRRDQANHPDAIELMARLEHLSVVVPATTSGYLQFVRYQDLVEIASETDTVLQLLYRAGHFITAGLPLARVWPPTNAPDVMAALQRAHVAGPQRTLTQDPVFPIDQLVEIAVRALSPAVNDPFTALTCIDWLTDGLCRISERELPGGVHRDAGGRIRLVEPSPDYARIVNRASDKIRQASREMPAVAIRQVDGLTKVVAYTRTDAQRQVLARQAERILRASEEAIPDPDDRQDVRNRHAAFAAAVALAETHPPITLPDQTTPHPKTPQVT